nr:immunoglobulin light chain junction region [Macaca mulatta]MOW60577.1 immunoglobulin light chain junction region [Macaca mulatta]MOW61652.1 immunoglobulin light chain junction region [Macaca mulatta]
DYYCYSGDDNNLLF